MHKTSLRLHGQEHFWYIFKVHSIYTITRRVKQCMFYLHVPPPPSTVLGTTQKLGDDWNNIDSNNSFIFLNLHNEAQK